MKPTKFLFLTSIIILTIPILGLWISTEWVAGMLGYQKQLGPPVFVLFGFPIFKPKFLYWWYWYGVYAPKQFETAAIPTYISSTVSIVFAITAALSRSRDKKEPTYQGSARWATIKDIEATDLLNNKGVVLGLTPEKKGRYLRHDGPEHIMVMAPTRSGKGVGIIIPTLLTWPYSVLVTDIKGENWGLTAGYRQKHLHNKVLKFDPTKNDGSSVRFNPLDEIRLKTPNEVQDIQNIADMLVDPQGTGQLDHWSKTGHALLVGIGLHLKYTLPRASLSDFASFLSNPEKSFEETLDEMLITVHDTNGLFKEIYGIDAVTHPKVAEAARELLNKSENERSGVLSTAMSFLGLYRDPIIARNTAVSDFMISDLMNYDTPVSLYLVVPPKDINRTKPLMRMILNQIISNLTEEMQFKDGKPIVGYKHHLLLLLDEFPALGRLDKLESALAFVAGYGLKAMLIIQSLNQLNKTYTKDNSIIDNCHVRIVHTPNDAQTPEFISKLLGTKTEIIESKSYQGDRLNPWLPKMSTQLHYQARALLTPGEVSQLPKERELIFMAGIPPINARKIFYFNDRNFKNRVLNAPAKSDVIHDVDSVSVKNGSPNFDSDCRTSINYLEDDGLEFFDDTEHDIAHGHDRNDPEHGHEHELTMDIDLM